MFWLGFGPWLVAELGHLAGGRDVTLLGSGLSGPPAGGGAHRRPPVDLSLGSRVGFHPRAAETCLESSAAFSAPAVIAPAVIASSRGKAGAKAWGPREARHLPLSQHCRGVIDNPGARRPSPWSDTRLQRSPCSGPSLVEAHAQLSAVGTQDPGSWPRPSGVRGWRRASIRGEHELVA